MENRKIDGFRDALNQGLSYTQGFGLAQIAIVLVLAGAFALDLPMFALPEDIDVSVSSGIAMMEKLSENYLTDPRIPAWQLHCVGAFIFLDGYALLRGVQMILEMF